MLSDITINLTGAQPSGSASFGIPLLIALMPAPAVTEGEKPKTATPIPYTECTTLADVVTAGFDENSKLYKAVQLMKLQAKKPKTFAIYGSTATNAEAAVKEVIDEGWRQLITVDLGTSTLVQVAAVIEAAEGKFYTPSFSIVGADKMTNEQFKTARDAALEGLGAFDRTFPIYYDDSVDTPEAAVIGETAARAVGSFTYKNIILKGIEPLKVTEARLAIIQGTGDAPKAATIVRKAGDIVLSDGRVASGEYADVVDSFDIEDNPFSDLLEEVGSVKDFVEGMITGITAEFNEFKKECTEAASGVSEITKECENMRSAADHVTSGIERFDNGFTAARDRASEFGRKLRDIVNSGIEKITHPIQTIKTALGSAVYAAGGFVTKLKDIGKQNPNSLISHLTSAKKALTQGKTSASGFVTALKNIGKISVSGAVSGVKNIVSHAKTATKEGGVLYTALKKVAGVSMNTVHKGLTKIGDAAKNAASHIGSGLMTAAKVGTGALIAGARMKSLTLS